MVTHTIIESPPGSRQYLSRPETTAEQEQNKRVVERAAPALGVPVQFVRIDYYGDRARVRFRGGQVVWVDSI